MLGPLLLLVIRRQQCACTRCSAARLSGVPIPAVAVIAGVRIALVGGHEPLLPLLWSSKGCKYVLPTLLRQMRTRHNPPAWRRNR